MNSKDRVLANQKASAFERLSPPPSLHSNWKWIHINLIWARNKVISSIKAKRRPNWNTSKWMLNCYRIEKKILKQSIYNLRTKLIARLVIRITLWWPWSFKITLIINLSHNRKYLIQILKLGGHHGKIIQSLKSEKETRLVSVKIK